MSFGISDSIYLTNCLIEAFSISLEKQLSMAIGRKLAGHFDPFLLSTGLILDIFSIEGNFPSLKLLLIIDVKGAARKLAELFISLLGTLSKPELDFAGIDFRPNQSV